MKPFLSACLIVKNEEEMLGKCLESLRRVIEEIIVVDTGSTDSTKEIARQFTDKVYDFEWMNDFLRRVISQHLKRMGNGLLRLMLMSV